MFKDWREDDQGSADILDVDAVAEMLRCEAATVEERTRSGDLPGLKFGRSWVFPRAALLRRLVELAIEEASARKAPPPARRAKVTPQPFVAPQPQPPKGRGRTPPALPAFPAR